MFKRWIIVAALTCGVLTPTAAFARAWRDLKGNIINADFVKIEGGMIYLKPENKYANASPFPFYEFCEADQEFVKMILKKKGQLDRIPPPPPPPRKDEPGGQVNQPRPVNTPRLPVTVTPNTATVSPSSDNGPDSSQVKSPRAASATDKFSPSIPITVTPTTPTPAAPISNTSAANTTQNVASSTPASARFVPSFGQQRKEYKQCLSCKKEIPLNSTAGQKCPHCGVYWSAEQNEFGQVTKAAHGDFNDDQLFRRGSVRLAFLIGAFVIGGIAKLVHNNK